MRKAYGNHRDDIMQPLVLKAADAMRYHNAAYKFAKEGDVVMFTEGARWVGGHQDGEHDSIRDGYSSAKLDTRHNLVVYVPLADWLADGNPLPK